MKKQVAAFAIALFLSVAAHAKGGHGSGGKAGGGARPHAHPVAPRVSPHAVPVRSGGKPGPGPHTTPGSGCPLASHCGSGWNGTLLQRSVFRSEKAATCFCDPPCDEGFRCQGDDLGETCSCAREP